MLLLHSLNPEQRTAAEHLDGPMLVHAGPGTGKTHTLVLRIAHLIAHHRVDPAQILAVTFTNEAANQLKRRLRGVPGGQTPLPAVSTLHAFSYRFLTDARGPLAVLQGKRQEELLTTILNEFSKTRPTAKRVREVLGHFGRIKNQPALDFQWPVLEGIFSMKDCFEAYQKALRDKNLYDFDDLIREAYFSLKQDAERLALCQDRFRYFLVDEYQDLNPLQATFIDLLASRHRNLWVIGDPDQAIYSWRGSDPSLMTGFDERYKEARIVILKYNYRNPPSVLKAATHLIENNSLRIPKATQSARDIPGTVRLWSMPDETTGRWAILQILESLFGSVSSMNLADRIEGGRGEEELHLEEVAILFRRKKEGESLQRFLEDKGYPTQLSSPRSCYEERPLKAFLALAHLLLFPDHADHLYDFLKCLPDVPLNLLEEWRHESHSKAAPFHQIFIERIDQGLHRDYFERVVIFLEQAEEELAHSMESFWYFLQVHFWPLLQMKAWEEDRLVHFLPTVHLYFSTPAREALQEFISQAETEHDPEPIVPAQKIPLFTLHAAKGLEFKVVVVWGLEEGNIPIQKADSTAAIEEERRLFYVGLTRAAQQLHLITVLNREGEETEPSRFLSEIPIELFTPGEFSRRYERKKKSRDKKQMQLSLF